jgi:hypothetical protein
VESITELSNLITDIEVLQGHSLNYLILEFDKSTGKPSRYDSIVSWPVTYFSEQTNINPAEWLSEKSTHFAQTLLTQMGTVLPNHLLSFVTNAVKDSLKATGINDITQVLADWLVGNTDHTAYREYYLFANATTGTCGSVVCIDDKSKSCWRI